jgi:hypothetical protein
MTLKSQSWGFKVPDTKGTDQHLSQLKANAFKVHCKYGLKLLLMNLNLCNWLRWACLLVNLKFLTPLQD